MLNGMYCLPCLPRYNCKWPQQKNLGLGGASSGHTTNLKQSIFYFDIYECNKTVGSYLRRQNLRRPIVFRRKDGSPLFFCGVNFLCRLSSCGDKKSSIGH
jgi:hypothetical protein